MDQATKARMMRDQDQRIEKLDAQLAAARLEAEQMRRKIDAIVTRGEPRDPDSLQKKTDELVALSQEFRAKAVESRRVVRRVKLRMAGIAMVVGLVAYWLYWS